MQPEITLAIDDDQGRSHLVTVRSRRFTIGRGADNDLIIDDKSLSRRHALIESFDGVTQLSDCGSQNGTVLNGKPVAGAIVLRDGDTISIGYDCRIRVRINCASADAPALIDKPSSSDKPGKKNVAGLRQANHQPATSSNPSLLSPPAIAVAIIIIILASVLGIAILRLDNDARIARQPGADETKNRNYREEPAPIPPIKPEVRPEDSPETAFERNLNKAAEKFMLGISSDKQPYYFPSEAWTDIKRKVEQYRKSNSLPGVLRSVKLHSQELVAQAKNDNIELNLVSYAALAKTLGGQVGNPVMVARQMLPDLHYLRITFGDKTSDGSLILIAALGMGRGQSRWHPLLNATPKMKKTTDRNVWYLHKIGKLNEPTYDFVLSFLALGIIAQDPRGFQVDADPLTF
jgi:FHA domain